MTSTFKWAVLLVFLAAQFFYWGLGVRPMDKVQEIRVAETAMAMSESGDWLVPSYNGDLRLRKPPLAYWLTALSYKAFGQVNEFTARFTSAAFATLTTFMLFFWTNKLLGFRSATTVAICFMSSYIALRYFRSSETDSVLLFFVVAACFIGYRILYERLSLGRILLLHLCMGLGFLTKGPAAIAIPMLLMLVCTVKDKQLHLWRKLLHPAGVLILLVTAFSWYAFIFYKLPDQAYQIVGLEVDATYITGRHANPIYFYIPRIFYYFIPWSAFIIPAALWLYKTRPHPPLINYAMIWFGVVFVILSLNVNKQIQYALLLTPPLMILIGHYLRASTEKYARANRIIFIAMLSFAALLMTVVIAKWGGTHSMDLWQIALLMGGSLLPVGIAKLLEREGAVPYRELLLASIIASTWIYGQRYWYNTTDIEGAQIKQVTLIAKTYSPLFIYRHSRSRVSFYAGRVVPAIKDSQEIPPLLDKLGQLYLVVPGGKTNWDPQAMTDITATRLAGNNGLSLWKLVQKNPNAAN
ncbi:MAG: glycosyltransferase family 39 protein [Gammaproteobacteria bacterium]